MAPAPARTHLGGRVQDAPRPEAVHIGLGDRLVQQPQLVIAHQLKGRPSMWAVGQNRDMCKKSTMSLCVLLRYRDHK